MPASEAREFVRRLVRLAHRRPDFHSDFRQSALLCHRISLSALRRDCQIIVTSRSAKRQRIPARLFQPFVNLPGSDEPVQHGLFLRVGMRFSEAPAAHHFIHDRKAIGKVVLVP